MTDLFTGEPIHVSNERFIMELFADVPEETYVVCAGFAGDPNVRAEKVGNKWTPGAFWKGNGIRPQAPDFNRHINAQNNTFFTISSFRPVLIDGRWQVRRVEAQHAATPAIVLDDIGSGMGAKIDEDKVALPPAWVLETSPDNFQVGYALTESMTDPMEVKRLQAALIKQGLLSGDARDPGMMGVTRYMRLPIGSNGKAKYVEKLGHPFKHQMRHWNPEHRVSVADIVNAYGLDLDAVSVAESRVDLLGDFVAVKDDSDAYVEVLSGLGLTKSTVRTKADGSRWVDIRCPWIAEHTDGTDDGSAYRLGGGYVCHHGHCLDRGMADLRGWLWSTHDVDTDALDWAHLPNNMKPGERLRELRAQGQPDLSAYQTVIREYGDRGIRTVVWSASAKGMSAPTIEWTITRALTALGHKKPDDLAKKVTGLIQQAEVGIEASALNDDLTAGLYN